MHWRKSEGAITLTPPESVLLDGFRRRRDPIRPSRVHRLRGIGETSGIVDRCNLTCSMPLVYPRTELAYGQIVEEIFRFESVFKGLFHKCLDLNCA